jgi:hypothetical protein
LFVFQSTAGFRLLHLQFILCDKLKIKLVEVSEIAVPAPYREMPATDRNIMRIGHVAVPALCYAFQFPCIVTAYLREHTGFAHILNPGDKDPGRTTVVARYLRLIGDSLDDLIRDLFAVVTIGAVGQKDEPVAHVKYLHVGVYEAVAMSTGEPSHTIHLKNIQEIRPIVVDRKKP